MIIIWQKKQKKLVKLHSYELIGLKKFYDTNNCLTASWVSNQEFPQPNYAAMNQKLGLWTKP